MVTKFLLAIALITTIISFCTVVLQILRKSYLEGILSFLFTLCLVGYFVGMYVDSIFLGTLSIGVLIPIAIAQAINSLLQYRKKIIKAAEDQ